MNDKLLVCRRFLLKSHLCISLLSSFFQLADTLIIDMGLIELLKPNADACGPMPIVFEEFAIVATGYTSTVFVFPMQPGLRLCHSPVAISLQHPDNVKAFFNEFQLVF